MRIALSTLLFVIVFLPSATPADYSDDGPLNLLITYRCEPANRPAFREYLEKEAIAQLDAWKEKGVIAEFAVFFNWFVDERTFDAMVMLRFKEYGDVAKWKEIEKTRPGGLCAEGLKLARPAVTSSADTAWQAVDATETPNHEDSVYLLIPYEYLGLVAEYKAYVDGYVIPQLDGWIREKALESYKVLLNRFATGDTWGSMLMLEYRNLEAFGKRKHVKWKVRAELKNDPLWVQYSVRKKTIRQELEPIITERLFGKTGNEPERKTENKESETEERN